MRIKREAIEDDPMNARALTVFSQVATRFCADTHSGGAVLAKLMADDSAEDVEDLMARVTVLYDTLCPPPKRKTDDG